MRVSIITPSFNQGDYLEDALVSVARQDYADIEHIVVDGGSSDQSVDVLRKHESQLAYWRSHPDGGQAAAINEGFRRSTGQILAWLNSDDMLLPGAVGAAVGFLEHTPSCDLVCGFRLELREPAGRTVRSAFPEPTPRSLTRVCTIAQETVFFRRRVVAECGYLDETFQHCLDWEYWNRAISCGMRIRLLPRYQGVFRRHPASKTSLDRDVRSREVARIYANYLGRVIDESMAKRELGLRWWLGYYVVRFAGRLALLDRPALATRILHFARGLSGD